MAYRGFAPEHNHHPSQSNETCLRGQCFFFVPHLAPFPFFPLYLHDDEPGAPSTTFIMPSALTVILATFVFFVRTIDAAPTLITPRDDSSNSTNFQFQNGLDAQALNVQFENLTASDPCTGKSFLFKVVHHNRPIHIHRFM